MKNYIIAFLWGLALIMIFDSLLLPLMFLLQLFISLTLLLLPLPRNSYTPTLHLLSRHITHVNVFMATRLGTNFVFVAS